MNKHHTLIFFSTLSLLVCSTSFGCKKSSVSSERLSQLIVYTYNSFSGEWGSGPEIARLFEEKSDIKVVYTDCGDSVQILSKAILEKNDPYADVVVGLDNNLVQKAQSSGVLEKYKPSDISSLEDGLENQLGGNWILTPYDYSPFAIIWNSSSGVPAPESFEDLTKDIYRKKLILMDARTSTLGVGFEAWVNKVYGDKADDYIKRLQPSILTVAPSWSTGYGMFTRGEAPLVISYTTSEAYHVEYGEGDFRKALEFTDGHILQIEGAGIIKNCKNPDAAKKFIDFLISEEAQNVIPLTQWMYPANKNVKLPECYSKVIKPKILR